MTDDERRPDGLDGLDGPGSHGEPGARPKAEAGRSRSGLPMGRPFGIPVYVSPTWFLVAVIITVMFEPNVPAEVAGPPLSHLIALAFAVLLYASVLVHELSHAVVARLSGLPVRAITLHILGGDTAIDGEPRTPGREFLIAAVGPMVNIVLAGMGLAVSVVLPLPPVAELLVRALTVSNLIVGLFNLLPGLPLDGGRLVRAVVWKITGRPRSGTMVAAWVGRGVAILVLAGGAAMATYRSAELGIGWASLIWSALLASFIWIGATQSMRAERFRDRIPLLDPRGLARRATTVTADVPLAEAIRRTREHSGGAIVIVDHQGHPIGLVSERAVQATPEARRPWIEVGTLSRAIEPDLALSADVSGEELIEAIRRAPASEYLLLDEVGGIFGVLVTSDLDQAFAGV